MNISNKTVLITGGGSGIGLAIAKQLSEKGNKVIITGRTEAKLQQAVAQFENGSYIVADINSKEDVQKLASSIGELDILINNAGSASVYNISANSNTADKAAEEIQTNYLSVLKLTESLLPLLSKSPEAAVVNVTSVLALVPAAGVPTYSASKAALHFYTQVLRFELAKTTNIKVFELMPPLVNTDFSKDIGGEKGIPASEVADGLIAGFESDTYELHIGQTAQMYGLLLQSPQEAFKVMNQR